MAAVKPLIYFSAGSALVAYCAMASFRPDEKKIKDVEGNRKRQPGQKLTPGDIIRISSTSDKPLYRLNKKELDDHIQSQITGLRSMEASSDLMPERLQRRGRELQLERQRKKQDRELEDTNRKAATYFLDQFSKSHLEIEDDLNNLASGLVENSLIPSAISKISKDIHTLQKYFSTSTMILCLHDVRKSQECIQMLQQKLHELEEKLLPKKKFGFKVRKTSNNKEAVNVKVVDEIDCGETLQKMLVENDFGVKDKINEVIVMRENSVLDKDIALQNLNGCTVKIMGSPGTLHMSNMEGCTIFSGPVVRSVLIENCKNCKFVVPCQQLRVHQSSQCDFYLHVRSRAIIEDTVSVRVAPYNWAYDGIDQHFALLGWDDKKNHWDSVDDFNWLASDKPSPNWCILPESDREILS
ncbi:Tubulin-specific chaperone C [Frankliniella fusca]|uniref:Tubulin-specific chaperone C n=1 Tax=Frankliniella fusca TaxID=407009 RepID=A0AAE1I120_9NEOP|nr:Tubulin-specific chaperone C [Frankliniella fusca]